MMFLYIGAYAARKGIEHGRQTRQDSLAHRNKRWILRPNPYLFIYDGDAIMVARLAMTREVTGIKMRRSAHAGLGELLFKGR